MSEFGGLNIGRSALYAHRRALDVTGHNLANVNTPGYSRQRVELTADAGPTKAAIFSNWDGGGQGVRAGDLTRITDRFLEARGLQEHATDANLTQAKTVMNNIELAVAEPSDTGLGSQINQFMSAWDDLANQPDNMAARSQLVEQAKTLTAGFALLDGTMASLASSSTNELSATVADINTIASQVAGLNNQIRGSVTQGLPSADLMDQRDLLVQQLSQLAGVTVRQQDDGVVDVYLGSASLVRGDKASPLSIDNTSTPGTVNVKIDALGVTVPLDGKAGALQTAVNVTIPSYRSQLTAVAQKLNDEVNAMHTTGFDLNGAAGQAFFQMGPTGIQVNPVIANDPTKIAVAATATALRDGSVANKIAQLNGAGGLYNTMVQRLGVESQTINRKSTIQSGIVQQVDAARDAASGVNIDEEMTNMISIQHAYDAAARFITAVDSMLETLIKGTGLVGR